LYNISDFIQYSRSCLLLKKWRFGYLTISPSASKSLLTCAQLIELFPTSEHQKLTQDNIKSNTT
jgi:hypothetical protein